MTKKPFDIACEDAEKFANERLAEQKRLAPFLNRNLFQIYNIDNKIKELEKVKQEKLEKLGELMDLAMVNTHSLKNGFTVKPDNKRKVIVKDIAKFMAWLKVNKKPQEVFDFFKDAMKISALKSFCEKEANDQRIKGIMNPEIDGVEFGEITYRRLTTYMKKEKK